MILKPGQRMRSQVCDTEVIVIRPSDSIELTCGGREMVELAGAGAPAGEIAPGLDAGNQLGKRYTAVADEGFEVLVTKAGRGTLADGGTPLTVKQAKPLPSSD